MLTRLPSPLCMGWVLPQVYSPLYRNWAFMVENAASVTQDLLVDFAHQVINRSIVLCTSM